MANVYGLVEHTEPFWHVTNTARALRSRDASGIPRGTNLYGNHPVYFEHRPYGGTHGVFLLSSFGMDVKIRSDGKNATTLEYNVIDGEFDFFFLAGSETDPPRWRGGMPRRWLGHLLRRYIGHLIYINAGMGIEVRSCFLFGGCGQVTGY